MPLSDQTRDAWLLGAIMQDPEHALLLLDLDGRLRWGNPTACRLLGVTPAELDGADLHRFFIDEERALGVPDNELQIARTGTAAEDDRWQQRADTSRLWANGVLFALRDADGTQVGFAKVLRNRTDARLQLDAVRNQLGAAREGLASRTAALLQSAHELRHPLSAIGFRCELLRTRTTDPEMLDGLDAIERQVAGLARLVEDMVAPGTPPADAHRRATLSINRVLRDAVSDMHGAIAQRGHRIDVLLASDAVCVDGDADRLRQVFANLLDNAVKYTPPNGHLWVKATIEGDECVARVEDDGIGLAPRELQRVFDMFARAEPEGDTRGSGIGLAVVKAIVEEHGGTVQVESEGPGCGAKFTVRLPVAHRLAESRHA